MILSAEVETGGLMGQLYSESLTQALAVYLLQNYSEIDRVIKPQHQRLTNTQLQQTNDRSHPRSSWWRLITNPNC